MDIKLFYNRYHYSYSYWVENQKQDPFGLRSLKRSMKQKSYLHVSPTLFLGCHHASFNLWSALLGVSKKRMRKGRHHETAQGAPVTRGLREFLLELLRIM